MIEQIRTLLILIRTLLTKYLKRAVFPVAAHHLAARLFVIREFIKGQSASEAPQPVAPLILRFEIFDKRIVGNGVFGHAIRALIAPAISPARTGFFGEKQSITVLAVSGLSGDVHKKKSPPNTPRGRSVIASCVTEYQAGEMRAVLRMWPL